MLTRVTDRRDAAFLGTVTYGFGTVAWYAVDAGHAPGSRRTWSRARSCSWPSPRRSTRSATRRWTGLVAPCRRPPAPRHRGRCAVRHRLPGPPDGALRRPVLRVRGSGRDVGPARGCGGARCRRARCCSSLGYNVVTHRPRLPPRLRPHPRGRVQAGRRSCYHDDWGTEDLRYIPVNAPILLLWTPSQRARGRHPLRADHRPGRTTPVRRLALPAAPRPGGHEHPAHQPGVPARASPSLLRRLAPPPGRRRRARGPRHRARRPRPLQPGLGAVRLPLQQRLRAVRDDPRHPGHRRGAPLAARLGARLGPGRRVGPGQRVGRAVGRARWDGERRPVASPDRAGIRRAAPWLVPAIVVFVGSLLLDLRTLMPGLGFWDTGRVPDAGPGPRYRPPHGLSQLHPAAVARPRSCSSRSGNRHCGPTSLSALLVSGARRAGGRRRRPGDASARRSASPPAPCSPSRPSRGRTRSAPTPTPSTCSWARCCWSCSRAGPSASAPGGRQPGRGWWPRRSCSGSRSATTR